MAKAAEKVPPTEEVQVIAKGDARSQYLEQLKHESACYPSVPCIEVRYNFSYTITLPLKQASHQIDTVPRAFARCFLSPIVAAGKVAGALVAPKASTVGMRKLEILKDVRGVVHAATMTLLLTAPGHGKTSFLKALAGRIPSERLDGEILYNGAPQAELAGSRGRARLKLLAGYVDQLDTHLPFLTVRETLTFAFVNGTVRPEHLGSPSLAEAAAGRVDRVLRVLALVGCADTIVGNELVRGISGGEKKRVTIGEVLVTNARLILADEISTGLDASVTFDICASLRAWVQMMKGTIVASLLQPTPEVFNLFDDVLLLRHGQVLYHGSRGQLPDYFQGLGFTPPPMDEDATDMADWITILVTHPGEAHEAGLDIQRALARAVSLEEADEESAAAGNGNGGGDAGGGARPTLPLSPPPVVAIERSDSPQPELQPAAGGAPPLTTRALAAAWAKSELRAAREEDRRKAPPPLSLDSPFAKRQYASRYPRSFAAHLASLLRRQTVVTLRNTLYIRTRLASACILSAILGSVWFQLDKNAGPQLFGMLLFSTLIVAFSNLSEVPYAVEYKYVAYKDLAMSKYPPSAYVIVGSIVHAPVAALETLAFATILFFMVGLEPGAQGGRWAFFWLTIWLIDISMGAVFRLIANVLPNLEAAQTAPGPIIALQIIFAGFLVTPNHMGWLIFLYYLSAFAYALRSLAHNEFYASVFSTPVPTDAAQILRLKSFLAEQGGAGGSGGATDLSAFCDPGKVRALGFDEAIRCDTKGRTILRQLNLSTAKGWKWAGVGFLIGFYIVLNLMGAWGLARVHIERNIGTSRSESDEEEEAAAASQQPQPQQLSAAAGDGKEHVALDVGPPAAAAAAPPGGTEEKGPLPFEPITLVWRDVTYSVKLPRRLGGAQRQLLQGISGAAVPGRMMALMGASGAGKTTLLDVLAGRKTSGMMHGSVLTNGFPKERRAFARLAAYCEQQDVHETFSTVSEALAFSAALRLQPSVPRAARQAFVEDVLRILELEPIRDRQVGAPGSAEGLSPGQRKILTIAVELVSNAPLIFLDEPTSGLDSRAAQVVVREVRKIASLGRTVICTIHQPSKELFLTFDDVCLLQRGGWQVYIGPLGSNGERLVGYLEGVPGSHPLPLGMNPASWMLDVLAGTDSSSADALLQLSAAERFRRTSSGSRASFDRASFRRGSAAGAALALASGPAGCGPTAEGSFGGGDAGGQFPRRAKSHDAWSRSGSGVPSSAQPQPSLLGRVGSGTGAAASQAHVSVGVGGGRAGSIDAELPTTDGGPTTHLKLKSPPPPGAEPPSSSSFAADPAAGGRAGAGADGGAGQQAAAPPEVTQLDGSMLQHRFLNSEAWAEHKQLVDHYSNPAPGASPPKFDSVFARSLPFQLRTCIGRRWTSYWRNTSFNFTRIAILLLMNLIFGIIYLKIDTNDEGGVQSLVSAIYMSSMFVAMANMNTILPVVIRERAVFYRERFSSMYQPEVHALSFAVMELPWLLLLVLIVVTPFYFMVGLNSSPGFYFFFILVVWQMGFTFISVGMLAAAVFPTAAVAQTVIGIAIPLCFLFGGLYLPYPSMPIYWKWAYHCDPLAYVLQALVPGQFLPPAGCGERLQRGSVPQPGHSYCPYIQAIDIRTAAPFLVDKEHFVSDKYGVRYDNRWAAVGYLFCFIGGIQVLHLLTVRFVSHIDR